MLASTSSSAIDVSLTGEEPSGATAPRRRWLALIAGWSLVAIGFLVAYGWMAEILPLVRVRPDWASMKFNAALSFAAFGAGAVCLVHGFHRAALGCGTLVIAIASVTVLEYALDNDLIAQLAVQPFYAEPGLAPGRMSPISAALFLLAGTALALLCGRPSPLRTMAAGVSASVIAGVALAALIGYATRAPSASAWSALAAVPVHVATAFLLVGGALAVQAAGSEEKYLPAWLPWAALIAGFACTIALGAALFAELDPQSSTFIPETALAIGTALSILMAVSLRSRRRLAIQRDLIQSALARRQEALIATARAEQLLRGVLETAPEAMIVVESDGRITLLNTMAERMFGYERADLIGRPIEQLVPEALHAGHVLQRERYAHSPETRPMGSWGRELMGQRHDGTRFPVDMSLSMLESAGRTLFVTAVRDITPHRQAEQRLRDSLHEKELLLKEVHHRVKNNLQVVASMLTLQAQRAADPDAREMLSNCRQRVMSMALVHEKLYGTSDLRRIDLGGLIRDIAAMLIASSPQATLEARFDIEPVVVDIETAFPVSLLVNELITNAIKHAFVGRSQGTVEIMVRRVDPGRVRIRVADDGIGGVTLQNIERAATLGSTIIRSLVRQLEGELSAEPGEGSAISLTLPIGRGTP